MKNLEKNCRTKECLMKSFLGESAARNRYTYFAKTAKKEGYEQISAVFLETAENEKEHAKIFLKYLGEKFEDLAVANAAYPIGLSPKTVENLEFAAKGENEENQILYPAFAKIAKEEGYSEIAESFLEIIEVEKVHEQRYLDLMENIKEDRVFKRESEVIWKCRNCGYHYTGKNAPVTCPACKHPMAYFELYVKNY